MATIVCTAEKVQAAAQATINRIKNRRIELDEIVIARTMWTRRIGWGGFYYPTREEAIKILDESRTFMGWRNPYAWGDLKHAENLLLVAKHGNPVTLNEEDVRVLF
jgi:hypothetical protein